MGITLVANIKNMKIVHTIAFILVVVGALNWLLVGLGDWNLVSMLLGKWAVVERAIYILVGISGILLVVTHKKDCGVCVSSSTAPLA